MDCRRCLELAAGALCDGQPLPEQVTDHLARCEPCRAAVGHYERMISALRSGSLTPQQRRSDNHDE